MERGGGSPAGSEANLTGDNLRRRPSHSRKASLESVDGGASLDPVSWSVAMHGDDRLLPALEGIHLGSSPPSWASDHTPSKAQPRSSHGAPSESVASAPGGGAERGFGNGREEDEEVSSEERRKPTSSRVIGSPASNRPRPPQIPPAASASLPPAGQLTRVKAVVATGGFLVDKPNGEPGKTYKGGDTSIVTIERSCTFRDLVLKLDIEVPEDDDAGAGGDPVLRAAKEVKIQYQDPSDNTLYIRIKNDNGLTELFEEYEALVQAKGGVAAAGKLRMYVTNIATSKGHRRSSSIETSGSPKTSSPGRSGEGTGLAKNGTSSESERGENRKQLQVVPSSELELINRLGGGAFGEVHLALWRGSEVAVKFLNHITPRQEHESSSEDEDDSEEENDSEEASARDISQEAVPSKSVTRRNASEAARARRAEVLAAAKNREYESFLSEAHTMAALQHPNVVFIYGIVDDGPKLGIVEEFMSSGSLRRLLNKHASDVEKEKARAKLWTPSQERLLNGSPENGGGPEGGPGGPPRMAQPTSVRTLKHLMSSKVRVQCALDVAHGMAYLHSKRFVHFDLKCDNVLTMRRGNRLQCKVCDFGLSKQRRSQASFVSGVTSHRGTLPWTAPELISHPGRASEKVDVYSFGILLWELWTGLYPYADMPEQAVMYGIMFGNLRPDIPDEGEEDEAPGRGATGGGGSGGEPTSTATAAAVAGGNGQVEVVENNRVVGNRKIPAPCDGWKDLMISSWAAEPSLRPAFDTIVKVLDGMVKAMNALDSNRTPREEGM